MTEPRVQILSLREWVTPTGEIKLYDKKHNDNKWGADTVADLLNNIDKHIEQIPEAERWNLYYTAAECLYDEKITRNFTQQNIIPFDLDKCDLNKLDDYIKVFSNVTKVNIEKCCIIKTGNGLHFIIQMDRYFDSPTYFDENRGHYKAVCGKLNSVLYEEGLVGEFDHSVFCNRRLLRLPNTENRKKLKGNHRAYVHSGKLEPQEFKITDISDLPQLMESDHINIRAYTRMPKPDTDGVQEGCGFLQKCKEKPAELTEPEWYAMMSIVGRLENGGKLVHEYSKGHPGYSPDDTDRKIQQALNASGPRTCENISGMFKGCVDCKHFGNIKSPISIRGESYLKTRDTGFWNVVVQKDGTIKRTSPNFDDLVVFYDLTHKHVVVRETELIYHWTGKYWKQQERIDLNCFIEKHMIPTPNQNHCNEFVSKMKRTNLVDTAWLQVDKKINLANGVLEVDTGRFIEHDMKYGFSYVLPFNHREDTDCPRWLQFIDEVTKGREEIQNILQEFMGMCLGFVDPGLIQRSAILLGAGANGKSVYLNTLKRLLGTENYSVVPLGEAAGNRTARIGLVGKMANITEETPRSAFMESSFFKDIVSGGEIEAHKMYHGSFKFKNTAKIIMACNELPELLDVSNGMRRRLLVIPFDRTFTRVEQDPHLLTKLNAETSAIFNWAIEGLRRLEKNSWRFSDSIIIDNLLDEQLQDMNPVVDWAEDNLVIDVEMQGETPAALMTDYLAVTGDKKMNKRRFSMFLKSYISMRLGNIPVETKVVWKDGCSNRIIPFLELKGASSGKF